MKSLSRVVCGVEKSLKRSVRFPFYLRAVVTLEKEFHGDFNVETAKRLMNGASDVVLTLDAHRNNCSICDRFTPSRAAACLLLMFLGLFIGNSLGLMCECVIIAVPFLSSFFDMPNDNDNFSQTLLGFQLLLFGRQSRFAKKNFEAREYLDEIHRYSDNRGSKPRVLSRLFIHSLGFLFLRSSLLPVVDDRSKAGALMDG